MNRAERRRAAKRGLNHRDLKAIQEATAKDAINKSVSRYSVAIAMVLRDKWGFGEVRLTRFLEQVDEMFDAINEGYIDFEDCRKTLKNECGIEIREV